MSGKIRGLGGQIPEAAAMCSEDVQSFTKGDAKGLPGLEENVSKFIEELSV